MRRRDLIAITGGFVVVAVAPGRAQQKRMPVVGYLSAIAPFPSSLAEFLRGLAEAGFEEGRDVRIEYRIAEGNYDLLPVMAAELVRHPVDVIVAAGGTLSGIAAKRATDSIPIVIVSGDDPVKLGLAQSLSHPGGNVTGVSQLVSAADAKRLELLHELVPTADRIAHLINRTNPVSEREAIELAPAARTLGVELYLLRASNIEELASAFDEIDKEQLRALTVAPDSLFAAIREKLVALAQQHAIPTMYFFREFVTAGGLISFGSKLSDAYHQVGVYTGRILKGSMPSELPIVQQSEQLELVINLKTAATLHLAIPPAVRARADEVIES